MLLRQDLINRNGCQSSKFAHHRRCYYSEKIVVVGGGTAGIGVSALLRKEGFESVTIVDPSSTHYYQPLWTLCGGGVKNVSQSARPMNSVLPKGTTQVAKSVASFQPESNTITTTDGTKIPYDYLVVAAGMQTNWDAIPGLVEGLNDEDSGVVSIYGYKYADKTWKTFQSIQQNKSFNRDHPAKYVFTFSPTPIKCAGAPQKIMWLLEDEIRTKGLSNHAQFDFWTPAGGMFGVPFYSEKLERLRVERGVGGHFKEKLIGIDSKKKMATFENVDTNEVTEESFDMLHVAPHMSAPSFLATSPLADGSGGWVDVNKHTLQSTKYDNVFGLGDCTNTPNSKTAAAITSQAPVVVHNLKQLVDAKLTGLNSNRVTLNGIYSGYASCPLIIGHGKLLMAEFGYDGKIMETFSPATGKFPYKYIGTEGRLQQRFFYFLKEQLFPFVYWNLWPRGLWYGTNGPLKPDVTVDENGIPHRVKLE